MFLPSSSLPWFQDLVLRFSSPLFGAPRMLWCPPPPRRPQCLRFGDRRSFGHPLSSPLQRWGTPAFVLGEDSPGSGGSRALWRGSCAHCLSPAGEGSGPSWACRSWTKEVPGVPRPVLGLGTPPAIVGPLGWLSLGKLAGDPYPVPLPTPLVPLSWRENHLSTSRSPPWRPAPSGCAQQGGATSVQCPLSRRGPGGLRGCKGLPLASCAQPWSRGAGLRLAWPAVGSGLWRWCSAFLFPGCVTLGALTRLSVPPLPPLQNGGDDRSAS